MPETPAAVVLDSVHKSFGGQPVLTDISLSLPGDAVTAIVGESGSGKSTLLEHINGLHRPDRGRVAALGQPVDYAALTVLRRRIGYAVQRVGLFPHLSADENITLAARLAGWTSARIASRRDRLLRVFELDPGLLPRFPHELSGGQQQRAGLCRALMLEPELLLLDEPFSGVDPITRRAIHREFEEMLRGERIATVLVTHDLREARRLAQFLVVIRTGRILRAGPTEAVIDDPGDDYVAGLLREHLP